MSALLIDFGEVPAAHCDDCLGELFKALAVDPTASLDRSMWSPHENPYLRWHVEDVTRRFQLILEVLQNAFSRALTGEPIGDLRKAEPWLRWDETEFQAARLFLESTAPARYGLDEWMLLVDYLIHRYLPDGVINSLAEYLTVRAALLGKIQANTHHPLSPPDLAHLAELVPTTFAKIPERALTPVELGTLRIAKARAAMHISDVTDAARAKMKTLIIEHVQAQMLGQTEGTGERLRSRLFDSFGQLNRDFRRIAVTESGECCNSGFIAATPAGRKVRRLEAYQGACEFCRSISGKIFTVVDAAAPDKNPDTDIWIGKSNVGRSAAPRKRVGGELVEREAHELWWCAAGVQHPHCRGSWLYVNEMVAGASPEFSAWLAGLIHQALPGLREVDQAA